MKRIGSIVDLDNSGMVLLFIAKAKVADSFKANLCDFYQHYCKFYGIQFTKPRYSREHKIPNIPTEAKLNLIIGHASKKYAIVYSIIKENGLRPCEVGRLKLRDFNLENGAFSVLTAKHGQPRILKLKQSTLAMLIEYVKIKGFSIEDNIFPPASVISNTFERLRTSLSKKLNDPELRRISLHRQ